ncbi:hypothetical protein JW930_01845 [Candidatus Woesearchaeota archaeon]|nr:hypothetical protein [Candidatus Woesearchaeota archaeon]
MKRFFLLFIVLIMAVNSVIAPYNTLEIGSSAAAASEPAKAMQIATTTKEEYSWEEQVRKCYDYKIKEYGMDASEAKEKCIEMYGPEATGAGIVKPVEVKVGEATETYIKPVEYYDENKLREKYTKGWIDDDELKETYEQEIILDRPKQSFGYALPSFEGREEDFLKGWILQRVGESIGEPEALLKEYCDDPDELLDVLYEKMDSLFGGEEGICRVLEDKAKECESNIEEQCNYGMKYSCPPSEQEIIELCVDNLRERLEYKVRNVDEECRKEWSYFSDSFTSECREEEQRARICDYEEFMQQCKGRQQVDQAEPVEKVDQVKQQEPVDMVTGHVIYDEHYNVVEIKPEATATGEADSTKVEPADCDEQWQVQKKGCEKAEALCDEDSFIEMCIRERKEEVERVRAKEEEYCKEKAKTEFEYAKRHCEGLEEQEDNCVTKQKEICAELSSTVDKCKQFVSSDEFKDELKEKIYRACKVSKYDVDYEGLEETEAEEEQLKEVILALSEDITTEEIVELATYVQELQESTVVMGIKLYKGLIEPNRLNDLRELPYVVDAKYNTVRTILTKEGETKKRIEQRYVKKEEIEEVLKNLMVVKKSSDVPDEFDPVIEANAEELLTVSEELEEVEEKEEEKSFGYKFKMFLGLAKKAEEQEIAQIRASKQKMEEAISELETLVEEIPDLTSKAVLQAQIEKLELQKQDIEELAQRKEKKAKGWFNYLFN